MIKWVKIGVGLFSAWGAVTGFVLALGGSNSGGQSPPIDRGRRTGPPSAGGALSGLSTNDQTFFSQAQTVLEKSFSVAGTVVNEPGIGLGPLYNANSCAACHAHPAVGGASPTTNPEIQMATDAGATNAIPPFISIKGPVRIMRFIKNLSTGLTDGALYPFYSIATRSDNADLVHCTIQQPDWTTNLATNNVVFRIPLPMFGDGLIENVPDASLIAAQNVSRNTSLGIVSGTFNFNNINGQISRMGWKGQQHTIFFVAAEAFVIEMGVTNSIFAQKYKLPTTQTACSTNAMPEDNPVVSPGSVSVSNYSSAVQNQAEFIRRLAPPTQAASGYSTATTTVTSAQITQGVAAFHNAGCDACHISQQTTGPSSIAPLNNVRFFPYSDVALHNMGTGLADNIAQGTANGSQWKTTPLWGLGQRLFLMHDGRETNVYNAIQDHTSAGSEANTSVLTYNSLLSASDQQSLLYFVRSL
jgi:CxxC motif-containing protein (DUF1111 family)